VFGYVPWRLKLDFMLIYSTVVVAPLSPTPKLLSWKTP
jgi:hypothetical protein